VWGHDGEDRGAANAFFFNPKTGVGAIALANAMDPEFALTYMVVNIDLQLMSLFELRLDKVSRECLSAMLAVEAYTQSAFRRCCGRSACQYCANQRVKSACRWFNSTRGHKLN
jgi:hypothetical protein